MIQPHAVIFDLWNTLIRVKPEFDPYPRIVRLLKLDDEAAFRRIMRSEWMVSDDMSPEDFLALFCARMKVPVTPKVRTRFGEIWSDYLSNVEIMESTTTVLETLREHGVKTAVVSNTVDPSLGVLDRL